MSKLNKETLEHLYAELGSVRAVGRALNIPKTTINSYFKKYSIKLKQHKKIKKHDVERALKQYGTLREAADSLGISKSSIYYYIDKFEIERIKRRFPYSKEELVGMYNELGSIAAVAAKVSKSYSTVQHWFKALDIPVRKARMDVYKELRSVSFSKQQYSILVGSLLGDGGFWLAPHSNNARLYIGHARDQLGYLIWKHAALKPFVRPIRKVSEKQAKKICGNYVNVLPCYRFYTIAHPEITDIFKACYVKGKKRVCNKILPFIDLVAIAVWLADDGSIQRNKIGEPYMIEIATLSFTYDEHLLLVEALRPYFKGTIKISDTYRELHGEERLYYRLRLYGKQHVQELLSNVKKVLPKCIHYKLT